MQKKTILLNFLLTHFVSLFSSVKRVIISNCPPFIGLHDNSNINEEKRQEKKETICFIRHMTCFRRICAWFMPTKKCLLCRTAVIETLECHRFLPMFSVGILEIHLKQPDIFFVDVLVLVLLLLLVWAHSTGISSIHCQYESIRTRCMLIFMFMFMFIHSSIGSDRQRQHRPVVCLFPFCMQKNRLEIEQITELCRATCFVIQSAHTFFKCNFFLTSNALFYFSLSTFLIWFRFVL